MTDQSGKGNPTAWAGTCRTVCNRSDKRTLKPTHPHPHPLLLRDSYYLPDGANHLHVGARALRLIVCVELRDDMLAHPRQHCLRHHRRQPGWTIKGRRWTVRAWGVERVERTLRVRGGPLGGRRV
eukprot:1189364-Prorocentrum_minimum.AAC.4